MSPMHSPFSRILFLLLAITMSQHGSYAAKRHAAYDQMLSAAQRMQRAEREIFLSKSRLGLFNEADDVNRTGIVGEEFTSMTTTAGYIAAKRTATNSDFAALLVKLLREQGISSNDSILVTMTGSFPGLNLALLCALDELKIPALRVASLGASSYGANQPDMTWIDMEDILVREGLLHHRSDYVTLGGTGDIGAGLSEGVLDSLRRKCARLGYPLLEGGNKRAQFEERLAIFGEPQQYSMLINVGGNHLMLGTGPEGRELPVGLIKPGATSWERDVSSTSGGMVFDFLQSGVPVLNLLHVEELAEQYGIPVDPTPLPRIGTSHVYSAENP